jgi:hypothetical protein
MFKITTLEDQAVQLRTRWGVPVALGLIIASTLAISIQTCLTKPFWADEILTIFVTKLDTPVRQWKALYAGVDGMPPAFYMVTRLFLYFPLPEHVDWRLPAVAGFALALFCVYHFVRWNNGDVAGLLAALLLASTQAIDYASEARPYGLLLGAAALAALCWQRADVKRGWTAGLGLSLMAAVSLHHLAALLVLCFAIAETALSVVRKRIRWPVWAAFAVSSVPALLSFPLLVKMKQDFGQYFWSKPSLGLLPSYYAEALRIRSSQAVVVIGFLLLLLLGLAWKLIRAKEVQSPKLADLFLASALLAFPVIVVFFSLATRGGFAQRYALPLTVGVAMAVPVAINWRGAFGPRLFTALFFAYMLSLDARALRQLRIAQSAPQAAQDSNALKALRSLRLRDDLPLVVSSAHDYLVAFQYGTPEVRARMLHLVGREQSVRLTGTDSASRTMAALSAFAPVQVRPVDSYIDDKHSFLLLTGGPAISQLNWLPTSLLSAGWHFEVLDTVDGEDVVLASAGGP